MLIAFGRSAYTRCAEAAAVLGVLMFGFGFLVINNSILFFERNSSSKKKVRSSFFVYEEDFLSQIIKLEFVDRKILPPRYDLYWVRSSINFLDKCSN